MIDGAHLCTSAEKGFSSWLWRRGRYTRDLSPKLGNGRFFVREIISPPSFQKLMSGSADSRSLALDFTHVHLCAIRRPEKCSRNRRIFHRNFLCREPCWPRSPNSTCSARSPLPAASTRAALAATCVCATLRTHSARAARRRVAVRAPAHAPVGHRAATDVLEQSESIADILSNTHTAVFLVGMHGMVHTDDRTRCCTRCSARRAGDARQPCPARPRQRRARPPKRPGAPRAAVAVERPGGVVTRARHTP